MTSLTEQQTLLTLAALALILLLARAAGELARRIDQPEVVGELLAGFLLGPSIFGFVLPHVYHGLLLNASVGLVLSGISWIGVVLLLLVAGMEVDLSILRDEIKPGVLAAVFAIVPSLIAGSAFSWLVLGAVPPQGIFLGIVLSVSAVSVVSKILIERGTMRRKYAQVILAAGIASEVMVWLFVSVVSALHSSSPLLQAARSALFAVVFFLLAITLGRKLVFWTMRRVGDATGILYGPLSLVLVLTFAAAALTQALGLHALLGAFAVGVLLSRSPRNNQTLARGIQSATLGFFGPIFFALAGMRVNILQLGSLSAIKTLIFLFVVGTVVKVGASAAGARLGGQRGWEASLIGVGLNLKGGTDVVVAVVGRELGLLSGRVYSMYAVVAILTVLVTPPAITWLERRTPPTKSEEDRLETEEAQRRSYLPGLERVLVPVEENLMPDLAASVMERIAASKHQQGQLLDITEFQLHGSNGSHALPEAEVAHEHLQRAGEMKSVEVKQSASETEDALHKILQAATGYDLIAIGAHRPDPDRVVSLGELQDDIIHRAEADVLVVVNDLGAELSCQGPRRILVPTNGLEYSMAAGDIAGALGDSCQAELVLFQVVHSDVEDPARRQADEEHLVSNAGSMMDELAFRLGRLGVRTKTQVRVCQNAGEEIVRELDRGGYQMVVLGGIDRGQNGRPYLGRSIRTVLMKSETPALILVSREQS